MVTFLSAEQCVTLGVFYPVFSSKSLFRISGFGGGMHFSECCSSLYSEQYPELEIVYARQIVKLNELNCFGPMLRYTSVLMRLAFLSRCCKYIMQSI